jgi:hypothetical protein
MTTTKELHDKMWKESKHADEQPSSFIVIPTLDAIEYIDKAFEEGKKEAIKEFKGKLKEQFEVETYSDKINKIIDKTAQEIK